MWMDRQTRLYSILEYYTEGASIWAIKTLMGLRRRECEAMLQRFEEQGSARVLYVVDNVADYKARIKNSQFAIQRAIKGKRWILPCYAIAMTRGC